MSTTTLRSTLAALILLVPIAGCGGEDDQTLHVLAASSLTDVFTELAATFEADHDGVDVQLSFGSSTDLAEQAADGAPGDVLATADQESMMLAEDAEVALNAKQFATNHLVIVTAPGNPEGIDSLADLAAVTWVRCADEVPCGRAATRLFEEAGIGQPSEPASLEEDARSTLDKVVAGEADAALVYASDSVAAGDRVTTVDVPEADRVASSYFIATLSQSEDPELADEFWAAVLLDEGQAALTDAGFGLP